MTRKGSVAAQISTYALVGGGTATKVTTDWSGNGYEVTVKKADGSSVEVHLNGSYGLDNHGRSLG